MSSLTYSESWCAVQVAPRCERKVAQLLEYKGYEQFLPTYKVRRKWSDRIKTIELPLFPGYCFLRIRSAVCGLILGTPGVWRIVGFGGRPSIIPDAEIAALQQVVASGGEARPIAYLEIGRKIRIVAGPLAGIVGIVASKKNHHWLVLSVGLIGKSVLVDLNKADFEAAS